MFLLTRAEERDIERESVIAVLDSVLRIRGSGKELAQRAGVTPVYLSYIRRQKRMPRVRTATQIARALPLETEAQQRWLSHVERYWELKKESREEVRRALRDLPAQQVVDEIRHTHHAANHAENEALAHSRYRGVSDASEELLEFLKPEQDPINYLELVFVLQDVQSVLNRNDEALWTAKRLRKVVENLEVREYPAQRERILHFQVNALHAEAVALHNLGLEKKAWRLYEKIEKTEAFQQNAQFWRPHLNRAQIVTLAGLQRFSITQVEGLEEQARGICEKRAEEYDPLYVFRLAEALGRAYIAHGNFKEAEQVLQSQYDNLKETPRIGTIHQVVFLRTFARLYWKRGRNCSEWSYFITEALGMGAKAGLLHQLKSIQKEYGATEDGVFNALQS